jgi:TolA-binding protein
MMNVDVGDNQMIIELQAKIDEMSREIERLEQDNFTLNMYLEGVQ